MVKKITLKKLVTMGIKSTKLFQLKTDTENTKNYSSELAMKEVAVLEAGKSFGELALISNKPRAATIKTKSNCYFAILGKIDYQNIYGVLERNKLNKKVNFIKSIRLFSLLTKVVIGKLSYFFEEFKINRNQYLYKQGDKVDYCYIVIKGEFDMSMPQYKSNNSYDDFDILMPNEIRPPIVEMLSKHESYAGKQYILEKSKFKSIQKLLKDRYLHEMNMIVSKSNLARLGPGSIIGDIEVYEDNIINPNLKSSFSKQDKQRFYKSSVKCITANAELYRIKAEDLKL